MHKKLTSRYLKIIATFGKVVKKYVIFIIICIFILKDCDVIPKKVIKKDAFFRTFLPVFAGISKLAFQNNWLLCFFYLHSRTGVGW